MVFLGVSFPILKKNLCSFFLWSFSDFLWIYLFFIATCCTFLLYSLIFFLCICFGLTLTSMEAEEDVPLNTERTGRTGGKGQGSAWFQQRAFVISLWSSHLQQPAFQRVMLRFIHVWLLLQGFSGLCQHCDIQLCSSLLAQWIDGWFLLLFLFF